MKQSLKRIKNISILLFLFTLLAAVLPRAQAQDVYWTIQGAKIMGSDLAGQNVVEVFDGTGMAGTPVDVAVTDTHIYWTDKNDTAAGGVWRANRDGSGAALFVTNPGSNNWAPQFIAIDEANDALYFSCYYTGLYSASLSAGGPAVSLGRPDGQPISPDSTPTTTGIALRNSNELLSVAAAKGGTLYSTNISAKTHSEVINWMSGGGYHGLAYDAAIDTVYITDISGTLYDFNLTSFANTVLLNGLHEPLGVELSGSGSHLLYVERGAMRKISAYDRTQPENSFELVTGQDAFFGVGIAGDPTESMGPQLPSVALPIVDTFDSGTTGSSILDQPTSDGKATWRAVDSVGQGVELTYGDDAGDGTLFIRSENGVATLYLEADAQDTESYWIRIGKMTITGAAVTAGTGGIGDNAVGLSTRRITDGVEPGYRWHPANYFGGDRVAFYYRPGGDDGHNGNQGDPLDPVTYTDVSIRVEGGRHRFYSNERVDPVWRTTEASFGVEDNQRIFQIFVNSIADTGAFVEMELSDISIEAPPEPGVPPLKRLYVSDSFDYAEGDLVGQAGGSGWAEPWMASTELDPTPPSAQVVSPGQSFGELVTAGNKAEAAQKRRAFRLIDVLGLYTGEETQPPSESIGWPGSSVWMSFIAEGSAAASDPFWGISLFNNNSEKLFFGKATNGTGLRLSAQGGAQQFQDAISLTDKHFIVIRIDFDPDAGDSATLFLNPDPMGSVPTDDNALGVYTGAGFDMAFNRVRLANGDGPGGTVDEIRIGATWNDVTPVPYDMPYNGFVNGDLEALPFLQGWSYMQHITSHPGIAPGSATAAYIKNDTTSPAFWPLMSQHRPNWLEYDTIPATDPVTGELLADQLMPTGSEWQVGFFTAVADAGAAGNRSLNLGIGNERPKGYEGVSAPAINFRITGVGGGQAYNTAPNGWQDVFPAGTFTPSVQTDGVFTNPTVYYIEFNGDYTTDTPFYIVSVEEVGGDFSAVSEPMTAFQYVKPAAGSGIITVRFNGAVQAPYVVDDIHMITTGEPPADGYAAWQQQHFGSETDPAIIGEDADSDGDGIPNLLEYAFGSNPVIADRSSLPTQSIQEISGEQYLTLSITRPIGLSDVEYEILESSDLKNWTGTAVQVGSPVDNGDGTETILYRSSEPVSSSSRWFLEVRVGRITMA